MLDMDLHATHLALETHPNETYSFEIRSNLFLGGGFVGKSFLLVFTIMRSRGSTHRSYWRPSGQAIVMRFHGVRN